MLASALGPTYILVSGTWANTIYFQDNDKPKLANAPDGYENVLPRKEWKGVIDFCKAVDGKLVTSFAISDGRRDNEGNWTPIQIEPLINYTKAIGGEIAAAEMFNEPSHASHGGAPDGVDIFAHNLKNSSSGIAVNIPAKAEQYLLTADEIQTKKVKLNGEVLELTIDNELPDIKGKMINAGEVKLPSHSILFLSFKNIKK